MEVILSHSMSRASAGSFADFFPTAPSVLQQKQKKAALDRRRRKSPSPPLPNCTAPNVSNSHPLLVHDGRREGYETSANEPDILMTDQDDRYSTNGDPGDLLNGVGSASSLTSTVDSVFSHNSHSNPVIKTGSGAGFSSMTPLTNHESSPPERSYSPRFEKLTTDIKHVSTSGFNYHVEAIQLPRSTSVSITPIATPPQKSVRARPGPGELKGFKALYDPELDQKLAAKDKKKVKVRYKKIGEEVSLQNTQNLAVDVRSGTVERES